MSFVATKMMSLTASRVGALLLGLGMHCNSSIGVKALELKMENENQEMTVNEKAAAALKRLVKMIHDMEAIFRSSTEIWQRDLEKAIQQKKECKELLDLRLKNEKNPQSELEKLTSQLKLEAKKLKAEYFEQLKKLHSEIEVEELNSELWKLKSEKKKWEESQKTILNLISPIYIEKYIQKYHAHKEGVDAYVKESSEERRIPLL